MNFKREKEKLYSRNFTRWGFDMNVFVSLITALLVLAFSLFTILKPNVSAEFFGNANTAINANFNWLYIFTVNASLAFLLFIGFSKFGNIRLGGYTAKPEFNDIAWFSMMFSAGIGIGIFFYGVAEPILHLNIPEAHQSGSQFDNFKVMYLHYGVHAWAIYMIFAIGLGYFSYNKGLPFAVRSLFYPLLKEKIYGIWGHVIDTIATLAVLFGLATSLGLGARQINAGLNYVFNIPNTPNVQVILIIFITLIATVSVVSGVAKGIKWLSEANLIITGVLLIGIALIGPTGYIFSSYFSSMGIYFRDILSSGLFVAIEPADVTWQGAWTIFYLAWWIAWAPFVGTFIARISKGRTIRQLALGGLTLPTIVITLSMTILGASGVHLNELNNGAIAKAINSDIAISLFEMFRYLTESNILQMALSIVAVIAVMIFFVTSSDSGSLVVSSLTSSGKSNVPKLQRIFWAFLEGIIAISILLIGGEAALTTLQSAVIILGLPFSIILLIIIFSLAKELQHSYKKYSHNQNIKLKRRLDKINKDSKFE